MSSQPIFLVVHEALLAARDIAAIEVRHAPVLANDAAINADQTVGSEGPDFALSPLLTDPGDLIVGAANDFGLAGMGIGEGLSLGAGAAKAHKNQGSHGEDGKCGAGHGDLLSKRSDGMSVSVGSVPFRWEEKTMAALN